MRCSGMQEALLPRELGDDGFKKNHGTHRQSGQRVFPIYMLIPLPHTHQVMVWTSYPNNFTQCCNPAVLPGGAWDMNMTLGIYVRSRLQLPYLTTCGLGACPLHLLLQLPDKTEIHPTTKTFSPGSLATYPVPSSTDFDIFFVTLARTLCSKP